MQICEYAADCGRRETDRCILNWGGKAMRCVYLSPQDCGHPSLYQRDSVEGYNYNYCAKCDDEMLSGRSRVQICEYRADCPTMQRPSTVCVYAHFGELARCSLRTPTDCGHPILYRRHIKPDGVFMTGYYCAKCAQEAAGD